jgi:tRNA(fMet)-specific endonuclease VapC
VNFFYGKYKSLPRQRKSSGTHAETGPAQPAGSRTTIEGFVARLELLPCDEENAFDTGLLRKGLRYQRQPIGAYECMISGYARVCGLTLVTRNVSGFAGVPGVRVG